MSRSDYEGVLAWSPRLERWSICVIDHTGPSPVRIQPRGVFQLDTLGQQLRRLRIPFMRMEFTDYTCDVFRAPVGSAVRTQTALLLILLRTRYIMHNRRLVSWRSYTEAY